MEVDRKSKSPLAQPVTILWGIGPERAVQLGRLGIRTVEDLLLTRPRRYEDRREVCPIKDWRLQESAVAHGRIMAHGVKRWRQGTRALYEFILDDGTGRLHCRWWNLPQLESRFRVGDEVLVFGRLRSLRPPTLDHPETELVEEGEDAALHLGRVVPVYPLTEGLSQRWLRGVVWRAVEGYAEHFAAESARGLLPDLPTRAAAVRDIHFPTELEHAERARRRLALDEFLELQQSLRRRRLNLQTRAQALHCAGDNRLMKPFLTQLGFRLTEAQTRVLREIRRDLGGNQPMRRLLQGDVGSGKTIVAACAALMTLESGFTVALMAPTEILAEQHFRSFCRWLAPLGVRVALRTGSRKGNERPAASDEWLVARGEEQGKLVMGSLSDLEGSRWDHEPGFPLTRPSGTLSPTGGEGRGDGAPGFTGGPLGKVPEMQPTGSLPVGASHSPQTIHHPPLIIGTHALIESGFAPERLGLVIIDEQHRFGVVQRERLVRKGHYPHLLVMTATPIPRTLGLTLYGDLDISVIDQLPPGRGQLKTYVRSAASLPKVWDFVRQQLTTGRQAYVVYPRVEEAESASSLKAVRSEFEALRSIFAPFRVGLLHGRVRSDERDRTMQAFYENRVQLLVASTVIEVGLDVPNAIVMVIENAENFGLAQLHQLRGRIGRGAHTSYCILVAAARTEEARARLQVLAESTDGFRIAEADLRLRGPGELLGREQSGLPRFRFGDLSRDLDLIERAKRLAAEVTRIAGGGASGPNSSR